MLENIFTTVLNMSITASIVAIVIILVRAVFHKSLPKIFSYAIWGVVLIRLLIPFSFSSLLSIFNILPTPQTMFDSVQNIGAITYIPNEIDIVQDTIINIDNQTIDNTINSSLPTALPQASSNTMPDIIFLAGLIWLVGIAATLLYCIYTYTKASYSLKTAILLKDDMLLNECSQGLNISRKIQLFSSGNINTPVVYGIIKPKIIIPKLLFEMENDETKRYIIVHELVHVKRYDYLLKPLAIFALCIHWFNPIIWLSFKLFQKDMEIACDEKVMSVYNTDIRSKYATSLINMAAKQNGILNGGLLSFSESNIKSRVKGIMNYKKPVFFIGAVVAAVLVVTALVLLTNPAKTTEVFADKETINTENSNIEIANTETINSVKELPLLPEPFKLSEAKFTLGEKPMTLRLVMTKGTHVTDGDIGPYGTDYYEGNLIGEIYDNQDKLVSSTNMSKYFTESVIFRDKFNLLFDEYNGDGLADFTVGQYVASNYKAFNIFTINSNGEIALLPVKNSPDGIICSKFDEYYSTKFSKTKNNGITVSIYDMEQGKNIEKTYEWLDKEFVAVTDKTEPVKPNNIKITLKKYGGTIDSIDLIGKLDKTTDETIKYVYNDSPNNITVGDVFEGDFSNSGHRELLVIFKFLKVPHAGGLDFSVAAIYDRSTLNLISQKSFAHDECQFDVVNDAKGLAYLIFLGMTTYQGHSSCTLQLFALSKNWEQLLLQGNNEYSEDKYKFNLISNGVVSVLVPEFSDNTVSGWEKKYYLKWDKKESKLNDFVPSSYTDEKGRKYFDITSTSPNGRYAIASHELGFDEGSYVLVYDIAQNKLISRYDILAQEFGLAWSPDNQKVSVTRLARIWIDTSIVDIPAKKVVSMMENNLAGFSQFEALGIKFNYTLNENRPDPYYEICEWSPDSKRVLMFYQWTDSAMKRQNGNFVYDLEKQTISKITQNKPDEGDHLEPKKPKAFKW